MNNKEGAKSVGNRRKVIKRGGSYTITIPAAYVALLGIEEGDILEIDTNGRELILRKIVGERA